MNKEHMWSYLAGFIDGDGWITYSQNKNCSTKRYVVGITQIEKRENFIKIMYDFLIENDIHCTLCKRTATNQLTPNGTVMINVHIKEQRSVVKLLNNIIPYLIIKKDLAIEALVYTKERMEKNGRYINKSEIEFKIKSKWTDEELDILLQMKSQGYESPAISAVLHRSKDSIAHKIYRLKLIEEKEKKK